jgi:hypothetical protein
MYAHVSNMIWIATDGTDLDGNGEPDADDWLDPASNGPELTADSSSVELVSLLGLRWAN